MLIADKLSRGNYVYNRTSIYIAQGTKISKAQRASCKLLLCNITRIISFIIYFLLFLSLFSTNCHSHIFRSSFSTKNVLPSSIRFCDDLMFNLEQYKGKNHQLDRFLNKFLQLIGLQSSNN